MLFFTLFFGIIEFGRFFYLYNTVQEVTRCAARQAVVTWRDDWYKEDLKAIPPIISIPRQCLFGHDELVAGWEISSSNIQLRALNLDYGEVKKNDPGSIEENITNCATNPAGSNCIRFVEASLWCVVKNKADEKFCDASTHRIIYQPSFGLIPLSVYIPNSTVTMPAESLGYGM